MLDCSDGLFDDPAPDASRRRQPDLVTLFGVQVSSGDLTATARLETISLDPPAPGLAEAVWSEFFLELAGILRDAWVALREALRNIVRNQRVMLSTSPGMES